MTASAEATTPADGAAILKTFRKPIQHFKAMPWQEVPAFMTALRQRQGMASLALQFCILTATRSAETLEVQWVEIDRDIWIIPPERTKSGRGHRIPLSTPALEILRTLPHVSQFIFPGLKQGAPLHLLAMRQLMRRMGVENSTPHGFRSTFRDWCAEMTAYPREVAERALDHVIGDQTERSYARSDLLERRRALMEEWGRFINTK